MLNILTREDALALIKDTSRKKHSIRVGKMMLELAKYLGEDEHEWEIVGLVHDLDYDQTSSDRQLHGIIASNMLQDKLSAQAINAIQAHDFRTGIQPEAKLSHLLISVDALDNLVEIFDKRHESLTIDKIKILLDDWNEEQPWLKDLILSSQQQNISLDTFLELCLRTI